MQVANTFIEKGGPTIVLFNPLESKETMSEKEIDVRLEQRIIIKFLARGGVNPNETWEGIRTQSEENTLSRTQVFTWHKKLFEVRESAPRSASKDECYYRKCRGGQQAHRANSMNIPIRNR